MSDDLEQLGPTGFQDLAAALAIKEFGADIEVMGPAVTAGRDLYYKGQLIGSLDKTNLVKFGTATPSSR